MCRYNATHCQQYVGKMVHVQTQSGMHRGMVDSVTSKGMYLRPLGAAPVAASDSSVDAELVYYGGGYGGYGRYGYGGGYGYGWGYGARFFIPFLTILALTSLLWW